MAESRKFTRGVPFAFLAPRGGGSYSTYFQQTASAGSQSGATLTKFSTGWRGGKPLKRGCRKGGRRTARLLPARDGTWPRPLLLGEILSDKIPPTVGFVNNFLRVSLVYQPCCLLPCCQGKVGELSDKSVRNLYVRGILSLSTPFG